MHNLIICFPGGSGGHLVAGMCKYLLYKEKFAIKENGSVHDVQCDKFLEGRPLDNSLESIVQEYVDINRLKNFDIALAHFRNLSLLSANGKRVVYIDIDQNDIETIAKRLRVKMSDLMNESTYHVLKGADWPSYHSVTEIDLPDINELRIKFLKNWYYTLPVDQSNILKVKFNQLSDPKWCMDLARFLQVDDFDKNFIVEILDKYTSKHI